MAARGRRPVDPADSSATGPPDACPHDPQSAQRSTACKRALSSRELYCPEANLFIPDASLYPNASTSPGRTPLPGEHRVDRLTWPRLAGLAPLTIGLLPVGAGCKQHGRHLPLGSDRLQAEWLATELAERLPALVWPTVQYGHYPAFGDYPGSPSVGEACFRQTMQAAIAAMRDSGHAVCVVLNSGISTIAAVNAACTGDSASTALHIYSGRAWQRTADRLSRQRVGGHADQLETAVILHLRPDLVELARARDESATDFVPGPLSRVDPESPNYSPSGAMGNPTLADPETGRALCRALLADALMALRPLSKRLAPSRTCPAPESGMPVKHPR